MGCFQTLNKWQQLNFQNYLSVRQMVSLIFSTTGSNTMQRSWIRCLLLSKNQTKDEVINLVCEAGCDWEGTFTCDDFLKVAVNSLQKQVNRLDDVRAAFRYVILYNLYIKFLFRKKVIHKITQMFSCNAIFCRNFSVF